MGDMRALVMQVQAVSVLAGISMSNVAIRIGNANDPFENAPCQSALTFKAGDGFLFVCPRGTTGRYLSITAAGDISLCELKAFAAGM